MLEIMSCHVIRFYHVSHPLSPFFLQLVLALGGESVREFYFTYHKVGFIGFGRQSPLRALLNVFCCYLCLVGAVFELETLGEVYIDTSGQS